LKLGGGLAVDAVIKGTTFVAALSTWLSATAAFATVCAAPGAPAAWVPLVNTAAATWLTATAVFLAALTPSLSLKTFTE
jgi:hypothetical protein